MSPTGALPSGSLPPLSQDLTYSHFLKKTLLKSPLLLAGTSGISEGRAAQRSVSVGEVKATIQLHPIDFLSGTNQLVNRYVPM